jgi:hypothetical protein
MTYSACFSGGIKVININKIKGSQTLGVQMCSPHETSASYSSKLETSGYRLKPKTLKPVAASPSASEPPKISAQIRRQKIGVCLMPNVES